MRTRLVLLLPIYAAIYTVSYVLSTLVRFEFTFPEGALSRLCASLPIVLAVRLGMLVSGQEWKRLHRYTTLPDLLLVAKTGLAATAALALVNLGLSDGVRIPRSILLMDGVLSVLGVVVLRSLRRMWLERTQESQRARTVIYGADDSAIAILRGMTASPTGYRIVGLISLDEQSQPVMAMGVPVLSGSPGVVAVARQLQATHVLFSSTLPGHEMRTAVRECKSAGLMTHVVPPMHEIVNGRYQVSVRDVTISDLLRREPNQLDFAGIRGYVSGCRVLVTGAAGSIGSELCRQLADLEPAELVMLDQSEGGIFNLEQELKTRGNADQFHYAIADITSQDRMRQIMAEYRPQLVFHAAAYKHVPLMESHPQEAFRNNVLGTKTLADAAARYRVERFVMISTDKAVRPTSLMGCSKLLAEKYLQSQATSTDTQFMIVRFGNVLNSAGSVVPTFRRQILEGGPITVTHPDIERFFMTIPEAVQLVLQAGAIGESGDVMILDMGEPVKITDLAKDMILLSGLRYPDDIDIVFTGLRPGEKLYEELFYESESGARRIHDKIFSVPAQSQPPGQMQQKLLQLQQSLNGPQLETARLMRECAAELAGEVVPVRLRIAA